VSTSATHSWLRRVSDYHSGGISQAKRAAVEAHLVTCVECQEALAMYRRFYTLARSPLRLGMPSLAPDGGPLRSPGIGAPTEATEPQPTAPLPPRRSQRAAVLGAVAAVLVVSLVAAGFVALLVRHSQPGRHATPTPTPTPMSTATPVTPTATPPSGGTPASWTVVTNTPSRTTSVQFAPSNPSVAYLCADDGPPAAPLTSTSRLYKSTSGGQAWQRVTGAPTLHPVPPPPQQPAPLAGCRVFVDASDANDVFLQQTEIEPVGASFAIARALWRSRDGGLTWRQLTSLDRTDGFEQLAVLGTRLIGRPHPSVGGVAACDPSVKPTAYSYIMGSDDGGVTWHNLGQSIESQGYSPHDFAVAGNTLFAAADTIPTNQCDYHITSALWRSTDGGNSWGKVTAPAITIGLPSFTPKAAGSGYYGVAWSSSGANSNNFTPLYSSDSGATWTALPAPPPLNAGYSLPVVAPSGAVLMDGDGGLNNDSVYVLRPGDATPAWSVYAPGSSGQWQIVSGAAGATLWSVSFNFGGSSQVEYLPLP
jgi:Putative zinc-finger